jgi:transaldolase
MDSFFFCLFAYAHGKMVVICFNSIFPLEEFLARRGPNIYSVHKNCRELVMAQTSYLQWAIENTRMAWWHDSAELAELDRGIQRGAVGATTNPFLSNLALSQHKDEWSDEIEAVLVSRACSPRIEGGTPSTREEKAESLMQIAITHAASRLESRHEESAGRMGYVCAQVNPARAADRECMLAMARRFHTWAPNIAVKLPAFSRIARRKESRRP